jgi:uncharacterized protein YerC
MTREEFESLHWKEIRHSTMADKLRVTFRCLENNALYCIVEASLGKSGLPMNDFKRFFKCGNKLYYSIYDLMMNN